MQTQGYLQRKLRTEVIGNAFLLRTSHYASCKLFDVLANYNLESRVLHYNEHEGPKWQSTVCSRHSLT